MALAIRALLWIGIAAYTECEVAALRTLSHTFVKAGAEAEVAASEPLTRQR